MGIYFMRSSSSFDEDNKWDKNFSINLSTKAPFVRVTEQVEVQSAPDPRKFTVEAELPVGNHLVLQVKYDEATNYEGRKILVFTNCKYTDIVKTNKGVLDPHFSDNKEYISPFARFEPTEEGWLTAVKLCRTL